MINWSSAFRAGLVGGVAMEILAAIIYLSGDNRMSMVKYWGCTLTGKNSGVSSYLAGWMIHLTLSVLIGFAYAWAFEMIWNNAGWEYGLMLGTLHWFIGGMALPLMDQISGCVKWGIVPPLKLLASGDRASFVIFLMGHLIYGAVIGLLYNVRAA